MNIVLTGFMGSGKTAVGRKIAEIIGKGFADTDAMIEEKENMTISQIFKACGEDYFRKLESDTIERISALDNMVISTGGGAVLNTKNIAMLKNNGIVINLDPDVSVIEQRLSTDDDTRPVIKNKTMEQILEKFRCRKPYYDYCDFKVKITNHKDITDVAKEILNIIRRECRR